MKISYQFLQTFASNRRATTTPHHRLGTLAGRSLAVSLTKQKQQQPLLRTNTPHRYFHHTSKTSTQHHIIPSADGNHQITNDPSTIKRNFRTRLEQTKLSSQIGGGSTRIEKQHAKGSLTARERINLLFDGGSFREVDALVTHRCHEFDMDNSVVPGDGVVVGESI